MGSMSPNSLKLSGRRFPTKPFANATEFVYRFFLREHNNSSKIVDFNNLLRGQSIPCSLALVNQRIYSWEDKTSYNKSNAVEYYTKFTFEAKNFSKPIEFIARLTGNNSQHLA